MRVLVTGATGQLAQSLQEIGSGHDVEIVAVGRPTLDLARTATIKATLNAVRPDVLINAAAYTMVDKAEDEPDDAFAINAHGAGEVAQLSSKLRIPIIQISTDYVFDGAMTRPYRESDSPNPLNVYGRSKLEGEEAVRVATSDHVIVRTSWVYSPFGRNFLKTILHSASDRDELRVVDDQHGSPTSALELARALIQVIADLKKGRRDISGKTFHIAGSGSCTWAEFASQILKIRSSGGTPAPRIVPIASGDFPAKAVRPSNSTLDCTAVDEAFGVRLPDWRISAAETIGRLLNSRYVTHP